MRNTHTDDATLEYRGTLRLTNDRTPTIKPSISLSESQDPLLYFLDVGLDISTPVGASVPVRPEFEFNMADG